MRPKNSTNVRFTILRFYQIALAVLGFFSVSLAAVFAERLFRSPPKRPESEAERRALASARRFDLELDGKRLVAWQWGEGPVALLAHGWGGSAGQMLPLVAPLRAAGYSVVAFDAPAHGDSAGSRSSLPQFAAALAAVAARLGPVQVLATHSMGGAAASLAIAKGLEVRRAVFLAPPADALEWFFKFARMLKLSPKVAAAMRRRTERRLHFHFDQLNAKTLGPSIPQPLLVIHDRNDAEVLWYDGAAVAQSALRGRLLMTEGLGHRRILRDPDVLAETVKFLVAEPESESTSEVRETLRCSACGEALLAKADLDGALCEACELERELFNPSLRWEHATHHAAPYPSHYLF